MLYLADCVLVTLNVNDDDVTGCKQLLMASKLAFIYERCYSFSSIFFTVDS